MTEALRNTYLKIKTELGPKIYLLAVTKQRTLADIEALYQLGQRDFGENRVQELLEKDAATQHLRGIRWHLIGPLQTNKVKKILSLDRLFAIHSLDDEQIVDELAKRAEEVKQRDKIKIFWQFNIAGEAQKHGFTDITQLQTGLSRMNQACFEHYGLMCMGPTQDDEKLSQTEKTFQLMSQLRQQVEKKLASHFPKGVKLSMGMSQDCHLALKYGTDWVRLGSTLFSK